jgi:hypothetical protein
MISKNSNFGLPDFRNLNSNNDDNIKYETIIFEKLSKNITLKEFENYLMNSKIKIK